LIIDQMATSLALPAAFLSKIANTGSHRYMEYQIPKRTGGTRTIHHPARELKLIQSWLLQNVLAYLPIHSSATAYKSGHSILGNAAQHVSNKYLLRVDFRNFFPSLKGADVAAVIPSKWPRPANVDLTEVDIKFIRQIVCRNDALTIGAPTSPCLSNVIMFDFDETWSKFSESRDVKYTRYADDLYFSTNRPDVLRGVLEMLRRSLASNHRPTLEINDAKTAFSSRKRRRLAAGLVLTSDRKISIGRHKKRILKSMVMKLTHNQLESHQVSSLRGWISYVRSVEPIFITALQRKYNVDFDAAETWEH
jgi:RNA-directed DNA polymerase